MDKKQTTIVRSVYTYGVRSAANLMTFASLALATPLAAEVTFETRVLSGIQAPGTASGVTFDHLGYPTINAAGQIAFLGHVNDTDVNTPIPDGGIWSETAGSIGNPGLVALEGDTAPGTPPDVKFSGFAGPVLNDAGQIAFRAVIQGPGVDHTNNFVIWSQAAGANSPLELIVRDGDAPPDTPPDVAFTGISTPILNRAGQIAFSAQLSTLSSNGFSDRGFWSNALGPLGNIKPVVRTGDSAPGTKPGITFSHIDTGISVVNDVGQIAFWAQLTGPDVDRNNDTGIWSEVAGSPGKFKLVARTGDKAPGTKSGVTFRRFTSLAFNDAGQTAFRGRLTGTGVDGTNNEGVWSEAAGSPGKLRLVARTGDAAPGTGRGVVFGRLKWAPALNNDGQIAFRGMLSGTGVDKSNSDGIWSKAAGSAGKLRLVARTGDAAPGAGAGVVFSRLQWDPVLNNAGQIAFRGELFGAGVDLSNNAGIWITDADGQPTLIIQKGDLLDVDNDSLNEEIRTVASININWEYDQPAFFNDAGQLAFRATFTDGTEGIFVATIPSPPPA